MRDAVEKLVGDAVEEAVLQEFERLAQEVQVKPSYGLADEDIARMLKEGFASAETDMAARALRDAYSGGAIAPMRQWLEPTDIDGAYAVQEINTRFWVDQGRRIVGRKAGLTLDVMTSVMQKTMGTSGSESSPHLACAGPQGTAPSSSRTVTSPSASANCSRCSSRSPRSPARRSGRRVRRRALSAR